LKDLKALEIKMEIENIPKIQKLTIREKIKLVEDLWDSILADEEKIPVPESHIKELNKRKSTLRKEDLLTLEELKSRVEKNK
jgi:putative addiction module component (TIGR02574 family)